MRTPLALALCTSAALALSAGCSPDSPTVAGPDAQLDQTGLGAGGHPETSPFTAGATQISGIGYFAGPAECNDPEGQGSDYDLTMTGDLEGCHYIFIETATCTAGGAYRETGTETFVGAYGGTTGTFEDDLSIHGHVRGLPNLDWRDCWTLSTSYCSRQWGRCFRGCHRAIGLPGRHRNRKLPLSRTLPMGDERLARIELHRLLKRHSGGAE